MTKCIMFKLNKLIINVTKMNFLYLGATFVHGFKSSLYIKKKLKVKQKLQNLIGLATLLFLRKKSLPFLSTN